MIVRAHGKFSVGPLIIEDELNTWPIITCTRGVQSRVQLTEKVNRQGSNGDPGMNDGGN